MYYPLSQIVTNLYSSNGEFAIKADLSPYTGYYWKNSQGKFFTGKTPQDLPALELIQIQIELDDNIEGTPTNFTGTISKPLIKTEDALIENEIYIDLTKTNLSQETYAPMYMPNPPTVKDYQIGEFRRYFCKKINEIIYIEINKDQFDLIENKSNKIAFEYYQSFNIPWKITGDKAYVTEVNYNMVQLVMRKQKLPQFNRYIKYDYLKYYISNTA